MFLLYFVYELEMTTKLFQLPAAVTLPAPSSNAAPYLEVRPLVRRLLVSRPGSRQHLARRVSRRRPSRHLDRVVRLPRLRHPRRQRGAVLSPSLGRRSDKATPIRGQLRGQLERHAALATTGRCRGAMVVPSGGWERRRNHVCTSLTTHVHGGGSSPTLAD